MRQRLVLTALAISTLLVLAFIIPLAVVVRSTTETAAFNRADTDITAMIPLAASTTDQTLLGAAMATTPSGREGRMTVVLDDGSVVGAPIPRGSAIEQARAAEESLVAELDSGDTEVIRVVRNGSGDETAVRVVVPRSEQRRGLFGAWLTLAGAGSALILIGTVFADRLARGLVGPITELSAAARRLGSGDLTARVDPKGPAEVQELAGTFNLLGSQVDDMIERERSMIADMSHRLRTPLTRLRLRIEQVDDDELAADLHRDLEATTTELTSIIESSSRTLDERERSMARSDLSDIAADRVAFWQALADEEDREVTVAIADGTMPVPLPEDEVIEILDILLDNVFTHTPAGTAFGVELHRTDGGARLVIRNGSPGPSTHDLGAGVGQRIVAQRLEEVGGEFASGPIESGFVAIARFPTIAPR